MLTLLPTAEAPPRDAAQVPLLCAVGVTALGGVAVVGWTGAVEGELRQQVRELLDDGRGVVRLAVLSVPVLAGDAVQAMVERRDE